MTKTDIPPGRPRINIETLFAQAFFVCIIVLTIMLICSEHGCFNGNAENPSVSLVFAAGLFVVGLGTGYGLASRAWRKETERYIDRLDRLIESIRKDG